MIFDALLLIPKTSLHVVYINKFKFFQLRFYYSCFIWIVFGGCLFITKYLLYFFSIPLYFRLDFSVLLLCWIWAHIRSNLFHLWMYTSICCCLQALVIIITDCLSISLNTCSNVPRSIHVVNDTFIYNIYCLSITALNNLKFWRAGDIFNCVKQNNKDLVIFFLNLLVVHLWADKIWKTIKSRYFMQNILINGKKKHLHHIENMIWI